MRKLFHAGSITVGLLVLLVALSPTLAASKGPTVNILGQNSIRTNQRVLSTYHFSPTNLRVSPGATVTFTNDVPCQIDCAHTISIVDKSQLPSGNVQVFSCLFDVPGTICPKILGATYVQGRANVAGEPSAFQGANSVQIAQGQSIEVVITASSGTTIHYMCAIHPWMQASIVVGNGDTDNSDA